MTTWQEQWNHAMVPNYGTPDLCIVSGSGSNVADADGNDYLDLLGGVAVNALGHRHPNVEAAVNDQMNSLWHVSNLYAHPAGLALANRLRGMTGRRSLFGNSGTEANEAAIKLIRKKANDEGRDHSVILSFGGSFHGRTTGPLALTGQAHHREGFDPLPGRIVRVPWNNSEALERVFDHFDVAGAFFEPIQGEGGVHPMNASFAATLQRLANRDNTTLVADEVQTGIGRTGRFWGHEHLPIEPHIITAAKALGGGWPIGVCLIPDDLAQYLGPGSHGCTFGGHPVAAAAALATLDTVTSEGLVERAELLGNRMQAAAADEGVPMRGAGLLQGIPVANDGASRVQSAMQSAGFLVGTAGKDVVRMAPPLTVNADQLMSACRTLFGVLHAAELPRTVLA